MDDTCEVEDEGVSDHRKVAVTLEASFQAEIVGKTCKSSSSSSSSRIQKIAGTKAIRIKSESIETKLADVAKKANDARVKLTNTTKKAGRCRSQSGTSEKTSSLSKIKIEKRKALLAGFRIVFSALVAVSIMNNRPLHVLSVPNRSLYVLSVPQGVVSSHCSMVVKVHGLQDIVYCLSCMFACIYLVIFCCYGFRLAFVAANCLAFMAWFSSLVIKTFFIGV
ncbi:unnamed protein product [Arabidopsis thaliana]|uniref:Transmembrane protein n=1 Tax=Arabidopsis thaliana TaxID=3702 RepID=A0A5S9XGR1_ARATH|nr:unnamed protein product [Arabidopsis thaliana]